MLNLDTLIVGGLLSTDYKGSSLAFFLKLIFLKAKGITMPRICCLLIAVFCLQIGVSLGGCPDFAATFTGLADQIIDNNNSVLFNDVEHTYFKDILGFKDDEIQHAFQDALKFFNETYGLDFSHSQLNEKNEYVLGNAKLHPFRFREDVQYKVVLNNWIQTGNTRTTSYDLHDGGWRVAFTGDKLLHGSYGGVDGITAEVGNLINYGFYRIDACDQSPVIIQFQNVGLIRQVPVEGVLYWDFDVYNNVLGHGKAFNIGFTDPVLDDPTKGHLVIRSVFTFPTN